MMSRNHLIKGLLLVVLTLSEYTMSAQTHTPTDHALTLQQQSIVSISALTATGNAGQLKVQFNKGLEAGLTTNEIKEILVQLYAYCGFPRSLNGINAFMSVLDERRAKGIQDPEGKAASPVNDPDKYQTGKKTLQQLTGKEEKALAGANAFAPAIDTFLKEHLFADIFSRDVLTFQQRELITVSALAAMSGVAAQLQAHIGMAMNTGITKAQFLAVFTIIDQAVSKSQGDIARQTLDKVPVAGAPDPIK
jgi:4-carboxymuconolactone decarboxylase